MPNWCTNGVTISHKDPAKIAALAEAMKEGRFFNHIIPVPKDLTDTVAGSMPEGAERDAHEAQMKRNLELYGAKDWYDFCVSHWGTKWDVDCDGMMEVSDDGLTITASFDSAWAPPIGVYEAMVEDDYAVVGYYYESGMAFVGKWDNGCDDCFDYSGQNSETVRDWIGEELDEYFGISESMAEYEESEKDEVQIWYEDGVEKRGLTPHGEG